MTDRLREVAKKIDALIGHGWTERGSQQEAALISELRSALAEPDVCGWYRDERGWHRGCPVEETGVVLTVAVIHVVGIEIEEGLSIHCPGCGRKIEVNP